MNPEEVIFRFHSRSLKKKRNKIRIGGVVLNCFEYENEKVKKTKNKKNKSGNCRDEQ